MTYDNNDIINVNIAHYIPKNDAANIRLTDNSLKVCEYENDKKFKRSHKSGNHFCGIILLTLGIITILLGFLSLKFTLFELLTEERLRMTPGFPPYEWWLTPPVPIKCRIYIFTVTNPNEFINGIDSKMKLKEIGPIVYQEHLEHRDIEFHDNSTMSYTINRKIEFLPEENEPNILNKTILVPNIVLLGMAGYLHDSSFSIKFGFRMLSQSDTVFVNTTIYNYFWNFTSPALINADRYVPFMVPQDNGGVMHNVYNTFTDRVNVKIGLKYGFEQFFMINTFNGRPTAPGYKTERGDCFASIVNSTEGALYSNHITKDSILWYWRKTVCRPVPLYYEKNVQKGHILGYKFIAKESMYDRLENLTADCYKGFYGKILPDGLSDVSKCYNELPVAVSSPHFYGRKGYWNDHLEGFKPSKEEHGSFTILEPTTGVPMEQKARSQSNMVLPKLNNFGKKIEKFSDLVIPMIWIEYHQEKLNTTINAMLIFVVNILPVLQYIITALLILSGTMYLYFGIRRLRFYL